MLTTHQLAVAQELVHRVAVISDGRILTDRPVAELLDQFREDRYLIEVAAPREAVPPSALYDLVDRDGDDGHTTLVVNADPGEVYRALQVLAREQVQLVSVTPMQPDLEEVFVRLVGAQR